MDIRIYPDALRAATAAAGIICKCLEKNSKAVLALASGNTPVPVYQELRDRCERGHVSFSEATFFALDEYLGIGAGDAFAFATFFKTQLLDGLDLAQDRAFFPNGRAVDPVKECRAFEARILSAGGIDLCLLGIGRNGHLAFNEPGPVLMAQAHVAEIADQTRAQMASEIRHVRYGLTMGMATIMNARRLVVMATGDDKADIVSRAMLPLIDPRLPASLLQLHPQARWILDAAAGRHVVGAVGSDPSGGSADPWG